MESRFVQGPAGRLDVRIQGPAQGPPVVLLHPHPRMGGTMGARLVHDLAQGLAAAGFLAVRFNYRGVGRSDGSYGRGEGEALDAAAVFDDVAATCGRPPAVVGYSFGGGVACRLANLRRPACLVVVATPLSLVESDLRPVDEARGAACPAHVVVGDHDGFVSVQEARGLAQAFEPPATLTVIPEAAHFLEPSRNPLAVAAVVEALRPLLAP